MRGAFSRFKGWRQAKQMRRVFHISGDGAGASAAVARLIADPAGIFRQLTGDFSLLCLTRDVIFDNRHGLLEKSDSALRPKPLSAAQPY